MIYQEEKEKGPGFLIYQPKKKVAFLGGREDGYVFVCGIPEVGLIFADFKRWHRRSNESCTP